MSISEEQLAALEAEVAELLGILESLENGGDAHGIRHYASQVAHIGSTAGTLGFRGLQDICLRFQEGLTNSGLLESGLNDASRERLEEWPTLVMGYLFSPDDLHAVEGLLDHLQNPIWSIFLPSNEVKVLRGLLLRDVPIIAAEPSAFESAASIRPLSDSAVTDNGQSIPYENADILATPSARLIEESTESQPTLDITSDLMEQDADVLFEQAVTSPAISPSPTSDSSLPATIMPSALNADNFLENPALSPTLETSDSLSDSQPEANDRDSQQQSSTPLPTPTATDAITLPILEIESEEIDTTASLLKIENTPTNTGPSIENKTGIEEKSFIETTAIAESEPSTAVLEFAVETIPESAKSTVILATESSPTIAVEEIAVEELESMPEFDDEVEIEATTTQAISELDTVEVETITDETETIEPFDVETAVENENEEDENDDALMVIANPAQQEMLEIICAEIEQLPEAVETIFNTAATDAVNDDALAEALSGFAENFELLANASASMGLEGLQQICIHLQSNLNALSRQTQAPSIEQRQLIATWPGLALHYLRALDDRSVCQALVNHLVDNHWPEPLPAEEAGALIKRLVNPKLTAIEAEIEVRPQQAQAEDVSLALPADSNQQLLDSLLQELPYQTAEFSAAVQRLAAGNGTIKDVEVAQRIAHTLKGAGNTVGVKGIATLTHHVEDILQALSKHGALPNRPLASTLLNAADCLEIMSEALLGASAPPTQALDVLQEVLDWANQIDRLGIPTGDEVLTSAEDRPTETVQSKVESKEGQATTTTSEATLRIPAHMVDEMLRLMGESLILTGQVQERVRKTLGQTKTMLAQNRTLQQLTNELEQLIDVRNVSSPLSKSMQRGDFDPLELEQYNELNTVTHRLLETATDARELSRIIEDNLAVLDSLLVDQGRLHRDSQQAVLRTRMVPIQTVVPRFQRSVRQTCRLVNKEAELVIRGADTLIDSNVLNGMVDPLMHILRNAVDHGIEPPDERKRLGKPLSGRIELSFAREGNSVVIRCQDDGAGLNLAAIQRKAKDLGLLTSDKPLEEEELIRLILLPGFSTQSQTTQTSGRGIGMDVVYSQLLEMKGTLRVQTKSGQGCLMEMRLPVTLISTHALLLQVRNQTYALSDRGIEQILYFGAGSIQNVGNTETYRLDNDIYTLTSLEALLNLPPDRREKTRASPIVVLVRDEKGAVRAVLVENILDSRDLVVKNLGRYLPKLDGIVGATIMGDGSVAPVLDLPELLRTQSAEYQPSAATTQSAPEPNTSQRRVVLAVDDSLSARRSLAQFIQDAGFEVRTARDGLEAIDLINKKIPDLILLDLEMPRMNGLELTSHLRANATTHQLPIIMITSRSTDKHRREAETVGVNAYLTKPYVEDELLDHINYFLPHP